MLQSIYTHAGCDYGCLYTYSPRHCFNPHTHAGCDPKCRTFMKPIIKFQSTHPRRVWLLSSSLKSATKNVSIHTPTQGVTHLRLPQRLIPMFQSTHPRRVWQKWNALLLKVRLFQSTHPRRVWHRGWHEQIPMLCFNPHTHAGCDRMEILENVLSIVSIHTPTQGVTLNLWHRQGERWFQSTHPRRVWHSDRLCAICRVTFQSTHPRRVWLGIRRSNSKF